MALLKTAGAALAAILALAPVAAIAEAQSLACTVGDKPMTLAYEGDDMTGTLTAATPWGDMTFPDVTYAGGNPVGEFVFRSTGSQDAVVMPDLDKLMACLNGMAKTPDELMNLDMLQLYTGYCAPKTPAGKPVPAIVEISASVTQDYGISVSVYRTYSAESPVADGHVVILLEDSEQPVCTVTTL